MRSNQIILVFQWDLQLSCPDKGNFPFLSSPTRRVCQESADITFSMSNSTLHLSKPTYQPWLLPHQPSTLKPLSYHQ